ncbi:hypothetical protein AB8S25_27230, partial [Klebsiella pneumoniae]
VFAGKKSAQIREILISESAWEEMTCLFAPSLNFDGADIAELPGTVHLYGEPPQIIQPGDQISFYPNCH